MASAKFKLRLKLALKLFPRVDLCKLGNICKIVNNYNEEFQNPPSTLESPPSNEKTCEICISSAKIVFLKNSFEVKVCKRN